MNKYESSFNSETGELNILCSTCGEPIVKSNERGMFCKDMCEDTVNDEEWGAFQNIIRNMINE